MSGRRVKKALRSLGVRSHLCGFIDQRMRPLGALQDPAALREDRRRPRIGRIDVQPQTVLLGDRGDFGHWIDTGRRRRSHGRDHAERLLARLEVRFDGFHQKRGLHPELGVRADLPHILAADRRRRWRPSRSRSGRARRRTASGPQRLPSCGSPGRPSRAPRRWRARRRWRLCRR